MDRAFAQRVSLFLNEVSDKAFAWDLNNRGRFIGACIFFGTTISFALCWGTYEWVKTISGVKRVMSGVAVPCVIKEVYVDVDHLSAIALFFWTIRYEYDYKGQTYESNRYNILEPRYLTKQEKERVREERIKYGPFHRPKGPYLAGEKTTCFVNLKHPSEAVLNREYSYKSFMQPTILTLALLMYSIGAIAAFIRTYYIKS